MITLKKEENIVYGIMEKYYMRIRNYSVSQKSGR